MPSDGVSHGASSYGMRKEGSVWAQVRMSGCELTTSGKAAQTLQEAVRSAHRKYPGTGILLI